MEYWLNIINKWAKNCPKPQQRLIDPLQKMFTSRCLLQVIVAYGGSKMTLLRVHLFSPPGF